MLTNFHFIKWSEQEQQELRTSTWTLLLEAALPAKGQVSVLQEMKTMKTGQIAQLHAGIWISFPLLWCGSWFLALHVGFIPFLSVTSIYSFAIPVVWWLTVHGETPTRTWSSLLALASTLGMLLLFSIALGALVWIAYIHFMFGDMAALLGT